MLNEGLYDIQAIKEIAKSVYKKFESGKNTFYFTPPDWSQEELSGYTILFTLEPVSVMNYDNGMISVNKALKTIFIRIANTKEPKQMRNTISHELVHAYDLLRSAYANQEVKSRTFKSKITTTLSYKNNVLEFNQLMHQIKSYKEKHIDSWSSIETYPELIKTIFWKEPTNEQVIMIKDKAFKEKLLKRLSREHLLPTALK